MTKRFRSVLVVIAFCALGLLVVVFRPHAEEVDETEAPAVSETDLQLYIKVYCAMLDDHDLTIDNAIKPYKVSLEDFRQLERRIQNQSRLVDRVRQALLDHAKEHSAFAQFPPTPSPAPSPGGQKPHNK